MPSIELVTTSGPAQVGKIELRMERRIAEHVGDRGARRGKVVYDFEVHDVSLADEEVRLDTSARVLGASGLEVSRLALGSWRTFERLSRDQGLAVMLAARDAGITFLDDARYDDETGSAPIPTGYSEVLFGELFRAAGWPRGETVVANKLWWEFWPDQSAAAELDASLARMRFDYVDVIYANPPEHGLTIEELVDSVADLVASGKARAWAIVNWPADMLFEASLIATRQGLPQPCAAQLPYSLVYQIGGRELGDGCAPSTRVVREWSRRSCSPAVC